MTTDEEKTKLAKLLHGLEVAEIKLPERCSNLIREFREKHNDLDVNEEVENEMYENPYIPDRALLKENEKKLKELQRENKREKRTMVTGEKLNNSNRPWRTQSNREKLNRIENELKRHRDQASLNIAPMDEEKMKNLLSECRDESQGAGPVGADRLRETVDEAIKNLPNFQYKNIQNSTATAIYPGAVNVENLHLVEE